MHCASSARGPRRSLVVFLGIVCVALVLVTGILQVTHRPPPRPLLFAQKPVFPRDIPYNFGGRLCARVCVALFFLFSSRFSRSLSACPEPGRSLPPIPAASPAPWPIPP